MRLKFAVKEEAVGGRRKGNVAAKVDVCRAAEYFFGVG